MNHSFSKRIICFLYYVIHQHTSHVCSILVILYCLLMSQLLTGKMRGPWCLDSETLIILECHLGGLSQPICLLLVLYFLLLSYSRSVSAFSLPIYILCIHISSSSYAALDLRYRSRFCLYHCKLD